MALKLEFLFANNLKFQEFLHLNRMQWSKCLSGSATSSLNTFLPPILTPVDNNPQALATTTTVNNYTNMRKIVFVILKGHFRILGSAPRAKGEAK